MTNKINRRTFVTGAAGAVSAALAGGSQAQAAQGAGGNPGDALPGRGLRAAVLEYRDRWTKQSTGLRELLEQAGVEVVELDLSRPANRQRGGVDLVVFGSFVNNGDDYKQYIERHGDSLRAFAQRGGVVLEMTQSDQFGNAVTYLP